MMYAEAERLEIPNAAYGVSVPLHPRHLTIYQAEGMIADLLLAIKDARRLNNEARAKA
jgi:hypothetical protein